MSLSTFKTEAMSKGNRMAGSDRYKTATYVSTLMEQQANNVVLVTGENYPDALTAAPLASILDAPILLTESLVLNKDTELEISRLKAKNVYIIGGEGVISKNIETELKSNGITVIRLYGNDRYETSLTVANYIVNNYNLNNGIVVTSGEDFHDAIVISSIAAKRKIPIILAPKDYVPIGMANFISKSQGDSYIIGGNDSIDRNIVNLFSNPKRIIGSNSCERNFNILKEFDSDINYDLIYIATNKDYPDALAGSMLVSKTSSPILLVDDTNVNDIKNFLSSKAKSNSKVITLGGNGVVPDYMLDSISSIIISPKVDQSDTSIEYVNGYPNVFKGFFNNTVYSNPEAFLFSGNQTKANNNIKVIASYFNDKKDISTITEIYNWMNNNLKPGDGDKFGRTAIDIIGQGTVTGCTDMGLAFAALTRTKGIPTVFVQTAMTNWISDFNQHLFGWNAIRGHILVEVLLSDNKWYLVDSTAGKLYLNYSNDDMSLPDNYYVFAKSIEVWDTGILNERENAANMMKVFKGFDVNKYKNPQYEYIDLISGLHKFNTDTSSSKIDVTILGRGQPIELIVNKFFKFVNINVGNEWCETENDMKTRPLTIEAYVDGDSYYEFFSKYLPDITSFETNKIFKYKDGNITRILIKAESESKLLEIINNLSSTFFTE
jgi:putative cell wall-binding protein